MVKVKIISLLGIFFILGCLQPVSTNGKVLTSSAAPQENLLEWKKSLRELQAQFALESRQWIILISVSQQRLYLVQDEKIVKTYLVSTSKYGTGNRSRSNKTPLGTHRVAEKIGRGAEIGTIFKAGRDTGKIAEIYSDSTDIPKDLITTRIMWLEGLEAGINKGRGINSYERRIYIHGTPEEGLIGKPSSRGCIRMRNEDVIELFNLIPEGTLVKIQ